MRQSELGVPASNRQFGCDRDICTSVRADVPPQSHFFWYGRPPSNLWQAATLRRLPSHDYDRGIRTSCPNKEATVATDYRDTIASYQDKLADVKEYL